MGTEMEPWWSEGSCHSLARLFLMVEYLVHPLLLRDLSSHFLSGFLVMLLDMGPFDQRIPLTSNSSPWILANRKHCLKQGLKIPLKS